MAAEVHVAFDGSAGDDEVGVALGVDSGDVVGGVIAGTGVDDGCSLAWLRLRSLLEIG